MRYGGWLAGVVLLLVSLAGWKPEPTQAQQGGSLLWIWYDEGGNPAKSAPAGTRYFRKTFEINRPVDNPIDEAQLDIVADDEYTVWINGTEVGAGNDWKRVKRFDVKKHLVHGKNVVAVEAKNAQEGPAGLLVRLGYVPNGQSKLAVMSDHTWKVSKTVAAGWQKPDFDDAAWSAVKQLGSYSRTGPWQNLTWEGGGEERFTVPPGFKVEMVVPPSLDADPKVNFSFVNLTFDAKGRLLVSQERGPIYLCTEPNKDGVFQSIKPYCTQVTNCQGMCWIKGALWLVGEVVDEKAIGPRPKKSPGRLYRVRDTNGDDKVDEVKLMHQFKGDMAEHGPHAIIHGPDDWLYVVVGNHAWVQLGPEAAKNGVNPEKLAGNSPLLRWPTGNMGPDQGKPNTTEDVLLPRLNDGRGHAKDILAPGGTIWRMDHEGKNLSLVAAGFRNHYDAAFNPHGELFTFDSDMEWDEALPWYRAVRVCHCIPGADFVWRTGAANTPDYYLDSLPPTAETGRGSPVGVEFYDHVAFPEKYRGAFFMADWAIGVIFAVHLERDGASYKGKVERFCQGAPMNVTDVITGPDGALYFSLGGRGTQGGVYRIVHKDHKPKRLIHLHDGVANWPQPLAGWSRENLRTMIETMNKPEEYRPRLTAFMAQERPGPARERISAFVVSQHQGYAPDFTLLADLLKDKDSEVRAYAVYVLGVNGYKQGKDAILKALKDEDALVRRRACEALIRAGFEPPVEELWPLLGDKDRFVRTAGRLVLQRIDPAKWVEKHLKSEVALTPMLEGIVALCKIHKANDYAGLITDLLIAAPRRFRQDGDLLLWLRTWQLALVHTKPPADKLKAFAKAVEAFWGVKDPREQRELAILLTHLGREKYVGNVHALLLEELLNCKDRQQQIHYFYCLRLLHDGWQPDQKDKLLAWYDSTKTWSGGHSFVPFLGNMLKDLMPIFTAEDRAKVIAQADQMPAAAAVLLATAPEKELPAPQVLADAYGRLVKAGSVPRGNELKTSLLNALNRQSSPEVPPALRTIADSDPAQRDAVARALLKYPSAENWPYLVRGLQSSNAPLLLDLIAALKKIDTKPKIPMEPKAADAAPFRSLLLAAGKLEPKDRMKAIGLLRHWNFKKFSVEEGDWKAELEGWSKWFVQTFPKEPPLPNVAAIGTQSKWKYDELLAYLEKDQRGTKGDVKNGRIIFEKANCLKCHKFGNEGEGLGPDLTTLKGRFKRSDTLEALLFPSKVISDQYRGTSILLKKGTRMDGLAAVQGDMVTVILPDATKVTLKLSEIDVMVASTTSPMPDKLLDDLTKEEIADLFAYLESEPPK